MIRSAQSKVMWAQRDRRAPLYTTWGMVVAMILVSVVSAVGALVLVAAPASADTFTNPTPIKIPDAGPATPYPSTVNVSGMSGPITDVNVTLHRVGHTAPRDIEVLLVSPSGDTVMLMSDNCGRDDIEDFTWILDQQHSVPMPLNSVASCPDFVYRPNPRNSNFSWPAPAPPGPHGTSLNDFNNENPNGTWKLFVWDVVSPDAGDIEGGWTLTLTTGPYDVEIPGSGTSGPASPYPATRTVSPSSDVIITDLNVTIDGIFHQRPDDLDVLLVGPEGQKVMLMSDACGSFDVNAYGWEWDDEAAAPMPDGDATNRCATRSHRPANYEPGESLPAPAPGGPYSTSLSSFDGTDPNGEWRLFVSDDSVGETGFFTNRFKLQITTVPKPDTTAPDTVIDSGPKTTTAKRTAAFTFSSTEPSSSFECKLDGATFSACASPKSYTNLKNGRHVFRVRAIDAAGNVDPTPAVRAFTVDSVKPSISGLKPKPNSRTPDRTPTVKAIVKDNLTNLSKGNIKLFLDGKPVPKTNFSYNRSTDRLTYTSKKLSLGKHTAKIVARDAAGNVGAKAWSFTVVRR